MELQLPATKIKQIRAEARKTAKTGTTMAYLLGMMNATNSVIPPAALFCH